MDFKKEFQDKEIEKDALVRKLFWSFSLFSQLFLLIALAISLFENISRFNTIAIMLLNFIPLIVMLVCHLTKKYEACYLAIVLCTNCLMMPIIYCTSGGTASGMPAIFSIGLALCATCSKRAQRFIALVPTLIVFAGSFILEIFKPELIATVDAKTTMFDTSLSVIICGTVFFVYLGIVMEYYDKEREMRVAELTKRNNNMQEMLSAQIENVENIKHIYHDTGRHWQVLSDLLTKGETQKAIDYLDDLQGRKESYEDIGYCENSMMNHCLNYLKKQCEEDDIQLQIDAKVEEDIAVSDVDLVSIISNLNDNAAQGCRNYLQPDKKIVIHTHCDAQQLVFECANSCEQNLSIRNGMLAGRGHGIRNVQKCLQKYNGTINYFYDGTMLKCVVKIPFEKEQ